MKIIKDIKELREFRKALACSVGFVPTMGALHQGHISLIKKSVKENEKTIVSIFVNPTQFLEGEDFEKYPKRVEADRKICELAGVDVLFMPEISDMYVSIEPTILAPTQKAYILEGLRRPKHFDGVLRVVLKLLNLTKPTNAYFGKKDAQQLYLIENLVKSLFLDTNIIPCEIVRDEMGLALSSRNTYLSESEKKEALKISKSLKIASKEIIKGNKSVKHLKGIMKEVLEPLKIEYIEIVNREFEAIDEIELKNSIILVACMVGSTRLIDNLWI